MLLPIHHPYLVANTRALNTSPLWLPIHHPYLIVNTFIICFPLSCAFIDYRPGAAATLLGSGIGVQESEKNAHAPRHQDGRTRPPLGT